MQLQHPHLLFRANTYALLRRRKLVLARLPIALHQLRLDEPKGGMQHSPSSGQPSRAVSAPTTLSVITNEAVKTSRKSYFQTDV